MSDRLGVGLILLIVVSALVASVRLGTPRKQITEEEFERRVREGQRSQAVVFALQQLLQPKAAEAVAVQQDLRHGYYNKKRVPGDGEDDGASVAPGADGQKLTDANVVDAEQAEERDA